MALFRFQKSDDTDALPKAWSSSREKNDHPSYQQFDTHRHVLTQDGHAKEKESAATFIRAKYVYMTGIHALSEPEQTKNIKNTPRTIAAISIIFRISVGALPISLPLIPLITIRYG